MEDESDVVVIGGGVIGCAVAHSLAAYGLRVSLLERGGLAEEASGAAAGMLAPLAEAHGPGPFLELCLASLALFPALARELAEATGLDVGLSLCGLLRVALTAEEEDSLRRRYAWQRDTGLPLAWLDGAEARGLEPALSLRTRGAVLSEAEGQVDPQLLVHALARAAQAHGARILLSTPVLGIVRRGRRVLGVRTPRGIVRAQQVVVAAGPWTGRLLAGMGLRVPTPPRRGQMLAYRGRPIRRIVWGAEGYLVPKATGVTYAGATVEAVGFRRRTTQRGLQRLRRMARSLVPSLARSEVAAAWAGLRPGSPDGLPIIGPVPGWEGLSVASGHFRNGVLLAPVTGRLLAQALTGRPTDLPLAPFSPGRFLA
ncbi:MAG TPA: glycine oxidase ThiO [Dehalococcoidia bacterium]|nr:glycine oxidase ThiO [Dehalococcoidia bacterium]